MPKGIGYNGKSKSLGFGKRQHVNNPGMTATELGQHMSRRGKKKKKK